MPFEEEILDMGHEDDDSLEEDAMFYNAKKTTIPYAKGSYIL